MLKSGGALKLKSLSHPIIIFRIYLNERLTKFHTGDELADIINAPGFDFPGLMGTRRDQIA